MSNVSAIDDSSNLVTVLLNGDAGDILAGGNGQGGRLSLYPKKANATIPDTAIIDLRSGDGHARIGGGYYQASGQVSGPPVIGVDGTLSVQNKYGNGTVVADGTNGSLLLGDSTDKGAPIRLDPGSGLVRVGGGSAPPPGGGVGQLPQGTNGVVSVQDAARNEVIRLGAASAYMMAGGNGHDGDLALFAKTTGSGAAVTDTTDPSKATIHLGAHAATMRAGGNGQDGDVLLFPRTASSTDVANNANPTIHMDGQKGNITIAGDVILTGAVMSSGGDCAEEFGIDETHPVEPGTVMVIGDEGTLRASDRAYDKRVAGVIAGAGDYRPGIVLDRIASERNRQPVALFGKVYCKVDAGSSPIEVGDLLTTSETPGCAMKALDPARSFGAVIGKALRPVKEGGALIPILVSLQ
ncbi:hypothetical protein [Occallatibacter riparius]|uniref:Uncharacterized protein n=1 Tax=Occallatibacter riparius TaxID=1002689 RepID=A0A9J7BIV0_9BACT|nr:hypothetical protein [Occallatibacter riparius]UWZ82852.1 hypothetical protein MOP44_20065 [Occallatibacter riparius]